MARFGCGLRICYPKRLALVSGNMKQHLVPWCFHFDPYPFPEASLGDQLNRYAELGDVANAERVFAQLHNKEGSYLRRLGTAWLGRKALIVLDGVLLRGMLK